MPRLYAEDEDRGWDGNCWPSEDCSWLLAEGTGKNVVAIASELNPEVTASPRAGEATVEGTENSMGDCGKLGLCDNASFAFGEEVTASQSRLMRECGRGSVKSRSGGLRYAARATERRGWKSAVLKLDMVVLTLMVSIVGSCEKESCS